MMNKSYHMMTDKEIEEEVSETARCLECGADIRFYSGEYVQYLRNQVKILEEELRDTLDTKRNGWQATLLNAQTEEARLRQECDRLAERGDHWKNEAQAARTDLHITIIYAKEASNDAYEAIKQRDRLKEALSNLLIWQEAVQETVPWSMQPEEVELWYAAEAALNEGD